MCARLQGKEWSLTNNRSKQWICFSLKSQITDADSTEKFRSNDGRRTPRCDKIAKHTRSSGPSLKKIVRLVRKKELHFSANGRRTSENSECRSLGINMEGSGCREADSMGSGADAGSVHRTKNAAEEAPVLPPGKEGEPT